MTEKEYLKMNLSLGIWTYYFRDRKSFDRLTDAKTIQVDTACDCDFLKPKNLINRPNTEIVLLRIR